MSIMETTKEAKGFSEQAEINKVAVTCHAVITVILILTYLLEVIKGSRTVGYYVLFLILALAPLIAEVVLFKRDPESKAIKHVMGIGYGIFYTFVVFTTVSMLAFTYAIPIYIVLTLYSDVRFCAMVSGSCFAVNIANVVYHVITLGFDKEAMADYEIQLFLMLLLAVYLCLCTAVLRKTNRIKMDDINREKENVSNLLNRVMGISGQMSEGIVDVTNQMQELGSAVSETRNAMQEVSAGTNETAESIQNQLGKTEDIQKHIERMADIMKTIGDSMEQATENVKSGKSNISTLLGQVSASENAGKEVVQDMKALEEYTSNMQSIIDLITSVASQTSLLALNASIEAARAGEAGRGFAVVATEISNLANQTQGATVNITEVIQNVSGKLKIAVDAVEELMSSNEKQNEVATQAAESFEKIADSTTRVDEQSELLGKSVDELAEANSSIVESIQTISAIMEEVSAHSQETYTVSDRNTAIVNEVSKRVGELNDQAEQLNMN